jgi:tetratricopeptide (TPR) repeat protein
MASSTRSTNSAAVRWLVLASLSVALAAHGQKKPSDEQAARALFTDGQKAYDLGEFDRALTLYSDAYKLKPLPGFLFNIAQCHRQLANFERAAFFFGRFIDNSKPEAPNVALAKDLKADMERRQAEKLEAEKKAADEKARAEAEKKAAEERAKDAPVAPPLTPTELSQLPPPPAPAVEPEPVTKKAWFWVVIGGAVVATAAGVTAGVLLSQPREVMYTPRVTSLPDIDGRR